MIREQKKGLSKFRIAGISIIGCLISYLFLSELNHYFSSLVRRKPNDASFVQFEKFLTASEALVLEDVVSFMDENGRKKTFYRIRKAGQLNAVFFEILVNGIKRPVSMGVKINLDGQILDAFLFQGPDVYNLETFGFDKDWLNQFRGLTLDQIGLNLFGGHIQPIPKMRWLSMRIAEAVREYVQFFIEHKNEILQI